MNRSPFARTHPRHGISHPRCAQPCCSSSSRSHARSGPGCVRLHRLRPRRIPLRLAHDPPDGHQLGPVDAVARRCPRERARDAPGSLRRRPLLVRVDRIRALRELAPGDAPRGDGARVVVAAWVAAACCVERNAWMPSSSIRSRSPVSTECSARPGRCSPPVVGGAARSRGGSPSARAARRIRGAPRDAGGNTGPKPVRTTATTPQHGLYAALKAPATSGAGSAAAGRSGRG